MTGFFNLMKKSQEGGPNEDTYHRLAMISLVRLYDRQAEWGPADAEKLNAFVRSPAPFSPHSDLTSTCTYR
jgi:hypothetical protein